jgi:hypothetical protein
MRSRIARLSLTALATLLALVGFSCRIEDIVDESAPVELTAHITDQLSRLDLADTSDCGTVFRFIIRNIVKRTSFPGGVPVDTRFLDVLLRSYRVTYVRTDGGRLVPRPFVNSFSGLVPAGGESSELPSVQLFSPGVTREAPFAALLPEAGGRDPETGLQLVRMDVMIEFFGETLAGDAVSTSMRFPLTVCISCGGCLPEEGLD